MNPDSRRLAKQIAYGIFFCLFWVVIIYGGYRLFLKPPASCFDNKQNQNEAEVDCGGVCPDCALKPLKPVQMINGQVFSLGGVSALFEFQNPNPLYGATKLPYTIQILDASGTLLQQVPAETFIYPGEKKYLIQNLSALAVGENINVIFGTPDWKSAAEFSSPNMSFPFPGWATKLEGNKILVLGNLQNNETLLFPLITINARFFDISGNLQGVSKTEIHDVKAFEDRFFQIEHPAVLDLDPSKTQLSVEAKRP